MIKRKQYYCIKCGKKCEDKPSRLLYQENDKKETYDAYHTLETYDLCPHCFLIFKRWIKNLKKEGK